MRSLLSKRSYAPDLPAPRLEAAWYVEADETYSVTKRNTSSRGYVAVRTLSGRGLMTLADGRVLPLGPNSIGLFEEAKIRAYRAEEDAWQFYWFEFGAQGWAPPLLNRTAQVNSSAQERAELERCFTSLNRSSGESCCMAEALFAYLLADWQLRAAESAHGRADAQDILTLLEKGRKEKTSVPELAREAGMCERSFRSAVQAATGLSPKMYMIKGDMSAAMELLRTTNMSIAEIAQCLDYTRPAYFSRVFKKYYGVSPQLVRDEAMF